MTNGNDCNFEFNVGTNMLLIFHKKKVKICIKIVLTHVLDVRYI